MDNSTQSECSCSGTPEDRVATRFCGTQKSSETARQTSGNQPPWIVGSVSTPAGEVPRVATTLRAADRLGAFRARWAVGRMHYSVRPGLYAVGQPTEDSPVMVSANYKMSFDRLRSQLGRLDAWILVLDTRGINVWCAAGKGTFGTEELVHRIEAAGLARVVSHRRLIVPQLGATGVAAHEVKKQSGFRVVYGPVRAEDLPAFMAAGMKATAEMRRVRFPLGDRLAVAPVELVMGAKFVPLVAAFFLFMAGLGPDGYSWARVAEVGLWSAILVLGSAVGSVLLSSALLPWLPGRALAIKGTWVGLLLLVASLAAAWLCTGELPGRLTIAAWCLLVPAMAGFLALNYTGATTYTSLSGVRKETALAVPIQAVCAAVGIALWLVGRYV